MSATERKLGMIAGFLILCISFVAPTHGDQSDPVLINASCGVMV